MILKFIENIGDKTIRSFGSMQSAIIFSVTCIFHMFQPASYTQKMRTSLIRQIYHTSITIIPVFSLIAFLFGSIMIGIVVSVAAKFNLELEIGSILVNFIINDFSPIFTAIFISLRSGTLIHQKFALLNPENEDNLINNIILPRIISGMLSTITLSILFSLIMITSGYIFISLFMGLDIHTYKQLLYDALNLNNVLILYFKSLAFGFVIIMIPIYNGLKITQSELIEKISIIHTLVKLFFAIFFIEVISLLFLSLLNYDPGF